MRHILSAFYRNLLQTQMLSHMCPIIIILTYVKMYYSEKYLACKNPSCIKWKWNTIFTFVTARHCSGLPCFSSFIHSFSLNSWKCNPLPPNHHNHNIARIFTFDLNFCFWPLVHRQFHLTSTPAENRICNIWQNPTCFPKTCVLCVTLEIIFFYKFIDAKKNKLTQTEQLCVVSIYIN